jgi:hypothetical protein
VQYDKSSKWLIQHHGDSVLRLAGIDGIESWTPLQAEVVHPRKLPDGLLEVRFRGRAELDLFLLEISAYPKKELAEQLTRGALLVLLDRGQPPEVICLVLHPRGRVRVPRRLVLQSPRQNTRIGVSWRVVDLWKLPADRLLALDDVGVVPWVPLTMFRGRPEPVFHRCRGIIDRSAPPDEHESLLAVARIFASLRYNDPGILRIFGGHEAMIEFPAVREVVAEKLHESIRRLLQVRFGHSPDDIDADLQTIDDDEKLIELVASAGGAADLDEFRRELLRMHVR